MKARRHYFEGAWRTANEIRALVPCLSISAVRTYLKRGMKTRREMLSVCKDELLRNAGRMAARLPQSKIWLEGTR